MAEQEGIVETKWNIKMKQRWKKWMAALLQTKMTAKSNIKMQFSQPQAGHPAHAGRTRPAAAGA